MGVVPVPREGAGTPFVSTQLQQPAKLGKKMLANLTILVQLSMLPMIKKLDFAVKLPSAPQSCFWLV